MRRRVIPLLAIAVALLVAGGCARDDERPTGVAEKWLQEVGNQGRKGVRADATERAEEVGDPSLIPKVVIGTPEPDERYFSDLEVGRARVTGDGALVPYRLTARLQGDQREERTGTLVLQREGAGWRVVDVQGPLEDLKVPSEGGPLPARAAPGHWVTALLVGVVLTVICVGLVELMPRTSTGSLGSAGSGPTSTGRGARD